MSKPSMPKQILVYMNTGGKEPLLDWFNALDKAAKNRIRARLDRVEL
jgi:hypothetical protein